MSLLEGVRETRVVRMWEGEQSRRAPVAAYCCMRLVVVPETVEALGALAGPCAAAALLPMFSAESERRPCYVRRLKIFVSSVRFILCPPTNRRSGRRGREWEFHQLRRVGFVGTEPR